MSQVIVSLYEPSTLVSFCTEIYEKIGTYFRSKYGILEVAAEVLSLSSRVQKRIELNFAVKGLDPLTCPNHELRLVAALNTLVRKMSEMAIITYNEYTLLYPSRDNIVQIISDIWCLKALLCEACVTIDEYLAERLGSFGN